MLCSTIAQRWVVGFNEYAPATELFSELGQGVLLSSGSDSRTDFIVVETPTKPSPTPSVKFIVLDRILDFTLTSSVARDTLSGHNRRSDSKPINVVDEMGASYLWSKGVTGKGVRIAIFDSGISDKVSLKNLVQSKDFTDDGTVHDSISHGSFVAGLISGVSADCPGLAPDAEVYIFKVFNRKQKSYTSWFLAAFNYALSLEIDILNFSIGGPDYSDIVFVDKIREIAAKGVLIVSAVGNDGPKYGTIFNPADEIVVLGVGGAGLHKLETYSSRGMTKWELPNGYGRFKPDLLALSRKLLSSSNKGGCKTLSGTSVASPVASAAAALLLSARPDLPAIAIRQVLMITARRLSESNIFEQGAGLIDLKAAYTLVANFSPDVTVYPPSLDFVTDCPYMWPFCSTPVFHTQLPILLNLTIMNSISSTSQISSTPRSRDPRLDIVATYSSTMTSYSDYLAIAISLSNNDFEGIISTFIDLSIESDSQVSRLEIPIRIRAIKTPPRQRRVLWDISHSLSYPVAFFPKDDLRNRNNPLDWTGDHPHTNFKGLFDYLTARGWYVDILGTDFTCFNASLYSSLVIIDPEDEFLDDEIAKLHLDMAHHNLSLVLFADWFNYQEMLKLNYYDDNLGATITPYTGGANIPSVNDLLFEFGIAFGYDVYQGTVMIDGKSLEYASGSTIVRFPQGGYLMKRSLSSSNRWTRGSNVPILGLSDRVAVFGDSSCLDDHNRGGDPCFFLLESMLNYSTSGLGSLSSSLQSELTFLDTAYSSETPLPTRRTDIDFSLVSRKLNTAPKCASDDFVPVQRAISTQSGESPYSIMVFIFVVSFGVCLFLCYRRTNCTRIRKKSDCKLV